MKKLFLSLIALVSVATLYAQDGVIDKFNSGAKAIQEKKFEEAATLFSQVIDEGGESHDVTVLSCVETAKKYLPTCYQGIGTRAAAQKQYGVAIENLTKAAQTAELYGNMIAMNKANSILAKVYQVQGGEAYNAKKWAEAAAIFEKGYAADKNNTQMANWLGTCFCEMGDFEKGFDVLESVAAQTAPKYKADADEAKRLIDLYTNNQLVKWQSEKNYGAIIAFTDSVLAKNPTNVSMMKVRFVAYSGMKNLDKVIELGRATAEAQLTPEDKSEVYYTLGAAYNAKEMKAETIEAMKKVTAGPNAEKAKVVIAELSK